MFKSIHSAVIKKTVPAFRHTYSSKETVAANQGVLCCLEYTSDQINPRHDTFEVQTTNKGDPQITQSQCIINITGLPAQYFPCNVHFICGLFWKCNFKYYRWWCSQMEKRLTFTCINYQQCFAWDVMRRSVTWRECDLEKASSLRALYY